MENVKQSFTDTAEFVDLFDLYEALLREEAAEVGDALRRYQNVLNVEMAALTTHETRYGDAVYGGEDAEAADEAVSASWRTMAKARLIATVDSLSPQAVEAIADPETNLGLHLSALAFAEEEEF